MDVAFAKTEAGRREIRERALALSRPARNLLLIIDASRTGAEWMRLVNGCGEADARQLQAAGLIEPAGPRPAVAEAQPLEALIERLDYARLYAVLTAQAREQLGLIKGFRVVLEVEKASGPEEMRAVARRFAETLQERGPEALGRFRAALAAG